MSGLEKVGNMGGGCRALLLMFCILWISTSGAYSQVSWRDLMGENNWEGLLDPLDINLRDYLINYGERASAAGLAFNDKLDTELFHWRFCWGFPRYPKEDFFSNLGIRKRSPYDYNVTNFIFSHLNFTKELPEALLKNQVSTWSGYVAVATDETMQKLGRRDIVVAWRGTMLAVEGIKDAEAFLVEPDITLFGEHNSDVKLHAGFFSLYTSSNSWLPYSKISARDQVVREVRKLVDLYSSQNEEISIMVTGHSLGSAIATLNAADIAFNGYNKPTNNPDDKSYPVTAFVFASPRVGDDGFKNVFDSLKDLHLLRIENEKDPIPKLPLTIKPHFNYVDVGQNLTIDTRLSPYLKCGVNPHNLDVYLHGVAGTQGSKGGFNLEVDLDTALINRDLDGMEINPNNIPANWWTPLNKDVVQDNRKYVITTDYYVPDPPEDSSKNEVRNMFSQEILNHYKRDYN